MMLVVALNFHGLNKGSTMDFIVLRVVFFVVLSFVVVVCCLYYYYYYYYDGYSNNNSNNDSKTSISMKEHAFCDWRFLRWFHARADFL